MSKKYPGHITSSIQWGGVWNTAVGTYGVVVEGYPNQYVPERDIEEIEIPHRNYPMLVDNGVYKPFKQSYTLHWRKSDTYAVESWLFGQIGYNKLTDNYHSDYYREAYILGGFSVVNISNTLCQSTVTFACKPFWYEDVTKDFSSSSGINYGTSGKILTSPVVTLKYSSGQSGKLYVKTYCYSAPKGPELTASLSATSNCTEVSIDCDTMTAYRIIGGTKTYESPTTTNGWPKLGYNDGYKYDMVNIYWYDTTDLTSATCTWKVCHLI